LALLLILGAPAIWLLWAETEYSGIDYCPWKSHRGHPVLIGVVLLVPAVAVMVWRERKSERLIAFGAGLLTGVLAGVALFVVAIFFGAGLRCGD
jgi:hypothetical protein